MTSNQNHTLFLTRYKAIHASFVRYCSSHAYGILDTADLVNDTIVITLEQFDQIKDKNKLLSFMIGVANNLIRNVHRRQKFKGTLHELDLKKIEDRSLDAETKMDIHLLYQAMNKLPIKQKEALILFEISGFKMKEISEIQKSSLSATKTRISRARQQLKVLLLDDKPSYKFSPKYHWVSSILL